MPRLVYLLEHLAARVIGGPRWRGRRANAWNLEGVAGDIHREIIAAADLGAFAFFGVFDGVHLGAFEVRAIVLDGYGTTSINATEIAVHIAGIGAEWSMWKRTADLLVDDLVPPSSRR